MSISEKSVLLKKHGLLNSSPEKVVEFEGEDFFDPKDLLQVKYEMLRMVRKEGMTVSEAANLFGFSRPAFYQINANFEKKGMLGLLPQKRGPKKPHKLNTRVKGYIQGLLEEEPGLKASWIAKKVYQELSISLHPRTIEKYLKEEYRAASLS